MFKTEILFKLRNCILVPTNKNRVVVDPDLVAAFYLELYSLGFRLTSAAYDGLLNMSASQFKSTAQIVRDDIIKRHGLGVNYNVLYKGFPESVPDFDRYTFYRIVTLITEVFETVQDEGERLQCGHLVHGPLLNANEFGACPVCQFSDDQLTEDGAAAYKDVENRLEFLRSNNIKIVDVDAASDATFNEVVTNLMASKSPLGEDEQAVLNTVFQTLPQAELDALVPPAFGFKEILAQCVVLYGNRFSNEDTIRVFGAHITTAPDVLRIAKEFRDRPLKTQGADYSVEDGFINKDGMLTRVKFKLSNRQRKLIVSLLDRIDNPCPDMVGDRMDWVHLNKCVHFGQFKKKFPNAFEACRRLFDAPDTIRTYESHYESLLVSTDTTKLIGLLTQRPGFFARVLHAVLRKHHDNADEVLKVFEEVASDVPMRTLIVLRNLFSSELRQGGRPRVYVNPTTGKCKIIDMPRDSLPDDLNRKASDALKRVIERKMKRPDGLTRVLIDPVLKNFKVPLKLRDVSAAKEKRERGSTVPVKHGKTVRAFVYWHEPDESSGPIDLDLSVTLYDRNFDTVIETSSYYYMNRDGSSMTHSGDIQSAPSGASEMVDIDIDKARNKGARYALLYVNTYTNHSFDSFEAFVGIQSGKNLGGHEKINPNDVEIRFDLTGSALSNVAAIYDLVKGRIIYGNLATDAEAYTNVGDADYNTKTMGGFLINEAETGMSMYEYFELFAKVNGAKVVNQSEPDVKYDYVFDYRTSQNIDEFNSQWLS